MNDTEYLKIQVSTLKITGQWSLHQDLGPADGSELLDSINRFGVLHPPVIQTQTDHSSPTVVCGLKRCCAVGELNPDGSICCRVIPPNLPYLEILSLLLAEQQLTGPLSVPMQARFTEMCRRLLPADQAELLLVKAGINSGRAANLISLLELEEPILKSLHLGKISAKTAFELVRLKPEDRTRLVMLCEQLSLNANKQRRLIDLGRIVAARTDRSLGEVLEQQFQLLPEKLLRQNLPQAAALYLDKLFRLSHPFTTRAEGQFAAELSRLRLPPNCRVEHAPAFEKDEVTLSIRFDNLPEFVSNWKKLGALLDQGEQGKTSTENQG